MTATATAKRKEAAEIVAPEPAAPIIAAVPPSPPLDPIHNKDLKSADGVRHIYQIAIEPTRSFESLLEVDAFSNVVGRLVPGSIIEVFKPGKWWAELIVARVDVVRKMVWTKVKTAPIDLQVDLVGDAKNLRVEENNGKFRVLRGNAVLQSNFENEAEALAWAFSGKNA